MMIAIWATGALLFAGSSMGLEQHVARIGRGPFRTWQVMVVVLGWPIIVAAIPWMIVERLAALETDR